MVAELREMGVRLMVSVWPSVSPAQRELRRAGRPRPAHRHRVPARSRTPTGRTRAAGADVGRRVLRRHEPGGARVHLEPGPGQLPAAPTASTRGGSTRASRNCGPGSRPNLRYHAGPGLEVGNLYPREHARAFYEGMLADGLDRGDQPGPVGLGGKPAVRRGAVVRRHTRHLRLAARADQGRAERRGQRPALVDHRHRRVPRRGSRRPGVPRADRALVPVRRVLPAVPAARVPRAADAVRARPDRRAERGRGPSATEASSCIRDMLLLRERLRPYVMAQMRAAHDDGAAADAAAASSISPATRRPGTSQDRSCSARRCSSRPSTRLPGPGAATSTCPPAAGGPTRGPATRADGGTR